LMAANSTPTPLPHSDGGSGADSSCEKPVFVEYGEVQGSLPKYDSEDCYIVYLLPAAMGDFVEITLSPGDDLVVNMEIQSSFGAGGFYAAKKINESDYSIKYTGDRADNKNADQRIIIKISKISGEGDYTVNISASPQNDAGSGRDASASGYDPITLKPGTYTGFVGYDDECDEYFHDPLEAGSTLVVNAIPDPGLDVTLRWYTSEGGDSVVQMLSMDGMEDKQGQGGTETISLSNGNAAGERFMVCRKKGTVGEYMLNISLK
jgi:hypothetical protein